MMTDRSARLMLSLVASLGAVCSPAVNAGDDRHVYLYVSAGDADTKHRLSVVDVIDGDDAAHEIGVGFALNPHLSLEAGYQRFGEPDGFVGCPLDVDCIAPFAREDVEVDAWTGAVRGSWPLTTRLSVFARAGLLAWDTSARSAVLEDSGTDLLYGLGLATDFNRRFGLQLSYEQTRIETRTLKLGLRVRL